MLLGHFVDALPLVMFLAVLAFLMAGFPVAFTLAGVAFLFAVAGHFLGAFDYALFGALPLRMIGLMDNDLLKAVPIFIYLGTLLQRTKLAEELLESLSALLGNRAGGLGIATILVSALLAPTSGVVGAMVLTMGLVALPIMLKAGYDPKFAAGVVAVGGTLGQILPPSIIVVILGDLMEAATIQAREAGGQVTVQSISAVDLYAGALGPSALLIGLYLVYIVGVSILRPQTCPRLPPNIAPPFRWAELSARLVAPVVLIVVMLGSIVTGLMYTIEAAASGAVCATLLALARRELDIGRFADILRTTMRLTAMVFLMLIGATTFSLIFRGLDGDIIIGNLLGRMPGGSLGAVGAVMAVMFGLGFFLDSLEILFLVVPLAAPPLLRLGVDPIWLAVLMAVNLQTSFLTPPFGFSLFFLRGVAPSSVATTQIYRGAVPFILAQLVALGLIWAVPRFVSATTEKTGVALRMKGNAEIPINIPPTDYGDLPKIAVPAAPLGKP